MAAISSGTVSVPESGPSWLAPPDRFDPAVGDSLATYARPCINGEIKRHFGDKRWQMHVKRPVQELVLESPDLPDERLPAARPRARLPPLAPARPGGNACLRRSGVSTPVANGPCVCDQR